MFLDDRRRPSDKILRKMPRRGDICIVRKVLWSTSHDTGERCIGLYLQGYHNPIRDRKLEYCYEAERFLPLKLIEALLAKETTWRPGGSPSCGVVMGLDEFFGVERLADAKFRRN